MQKTPVIIVYLAIAFLCTAICGLGGFLIWLMQS